MIQTIRSGGQTGVDREALYFGLAHGFGIEGFCPAGYRAEDGLIPEELRLFLTCTASADYAERTARNVEAADATLIIAGGALEGGTRGTLEVARELRRPLLVVDPSDPEATSLVRDWLERHPFWRSLNVAGPRESERPGIGAAARMLLERVFLCAT